MISNVIRVIILCHEFIFILTMMQNIPVGVKYCRVGGTPRLQGLMTEMTVYKFTDMRPTNIINHVEPKRYQIIFDVLHQYALCVCVCVRARTRARPTNATYFRVLIHCIKMSGRNSNISCGEYCCIIWKTKWANMRHFVACNLLAIIDGSLEEYMSHLVRRGITAIPTGCIWIVSKPNQDGDDAKYWV
jgi:hypothetical protein